MPFYAGLDPGALFERGDVYRVAFDEERAGPAARTPRDPRRGRRRAGEVPPVARATADTVGAGRARRAQHARRSAGREALADLGRAGLRGQRRAAARPRTRRGARHELGRSARRARACRARRGRSRPRREADRAHARRGGRDVPRGGVRGPRPPHHLQQALLATVRRGPPAARRRRRRTPVALRREVHARLRLRRPARVRDGAHVRPRALPHRRRDEGLGEPAAARTRSSPSSSRAARPGRS